jgi:2-oxoglutarate dehydrogenase complex dehydrogenase (E1) component-like enzyme
VGTPRTSKNCTKRISNNPGSVPDNWRAYFDAMQHVPAVDGSNKPDVAHASVIASFAERAKAGPIRTVALRPTPKWAANAWLLPN